MFPPARSATAPKDRIRTDGTSGADPAEQRLEIRHPPVVDVAVGSPQPPGRGTGRKRRLHVAIHRELQIYPLGDTERTDHHIGADSAISRRVAARTRKADMGRVADRRHARLRSRGLVERRP